MKVAVWRTRHEIADTVGKAVYDGLRRSSSVDLCDASDAREVLKNGYDCNIGYGILRGTADAFQESDRLSIPWFNIDRGYIAPNHYSGYYRVSLRGTQQTTGLDKLVPDYDRLGVLGVKFKPWRGLDMSKPVLICPPTEYVKGFFSDIDEDKWIKKAIAFLDVNGIQQCKIRTKDMSMDSAESDMLNSNFVLTFNCSLGWKAIAAGIPCISDPTHSFVGAYYKQLLGDNQKLAENYQKTQHDTRHELFGCMASLQLTLDEMRQGKIWELMTRLMSSSDTIAEKPSALTSPPTLSPNAQASRSIYTT